MPIPKENDRYSIQDYITWPDEERWEIIDGIAYDMSPAPNPFHQAISFRLTGILRTALKEKTCQGFSAPIDVVLSDIDVVQPDLIVVCDPQKITEKNIQGAPDLVIEILSPSTSTKDQREKYFLYEKSGVREYVIVDPMAKHAQRFLLGENGHYDRGEIFDVQQILLLKTLDDLEIHLQEIFGVDKNETSSNEMKPHA